MARDTEATPLSPATTTDHEPSLLTVRNILLLFFLSVGFILTNLIFYRIANVLNREKPAATSIRPKPSRRNPTHLLVVLGSGGHTAEMLTMLYRLPLLAQRYTHRTYVVSSGDSFSAQKANELEKSLKIDEMGESTYDIVTVRRARRVHQSLLTAPWSTIQCLWDCFKVLRGTHSLQQGKPGYPDLILTNGPGTGVCVVLAAIILLCLGLSGPQKLTDDASSLEEKPYHNSGRMRTIYVESWARVRTLSLSGTILLPLVDRFLVQWPNAVDAGSRAEYVGALVA
jgi:beta-1,4-N-acetylglucosaminyltransferase